MVLNGTNLGASLNAQVVPAPGFLEEREKLKALRVLVFDIVSDLDLILFLLQPLMHVADEGNSLLKVAVVLRAARADPEEDFE